jgi:hypothetical protein
LSEVVINDSLPAAVGGCWEVGAFGGRRCCVGRPAEMEPRDLISSMSTVKHNRARDVPWFRAVDRVR